MRHLVAMLALSASLASCGDPGTEAIAGRKPDISYIRALAESACQCAMEGRAKCRYDLEKETAGLEEVARPRSGDFLVESRGTCLPGLDGQCYVEGYYLRGGSDDVFLCRSHDAESVMLLVEQGTAKNGGDKAAAEELGRAEFARLRSEWIAAHKPAS